jgi:signal peptidase II
MQTEAGASLIALDPAEGPPIPSRRGRRHLFGTLAAVALVGYVADQLTKSWALQHLTLERPRPLVGDLLRMNLTRNAGAAFSIATNATWVLTVIAAVVVLVIVRASRRLGSVGWAVALGLLLGGSLGNLTDRIVREPGIGRGHVVDFLELPHWPIFNVADSCIVSAAVLIGILALRGRSLDGTHAVRDGAHG